MGFAGSCWTLCSILLLLGGNLGVLIKAPQDSVNGTVGHSVLLPVSYKFTNSSCFPLSIQWTFSNRSDALITCTVLNCSLSAEGAPKHCFAKHFPHAAYRGRVVLFPENASLLLRDLQLSDGGVYSVTFKQQIQTRHITLTVYGHHFTSEDDNTCAIFQKTSRVIKQQESSSHDESHMENKLRRDICTVYALIGDDQTQPRMM
ncbi:HEPACAM family member 2 isoform X3 [Struthio camelus]|uniref:HEPACAM family member 2 isoform X3 n=1 Tax=Struthio camelus TaxID=8801 RepID=UPI003603D2D9